MSLITRLPLRFWLPFLVVLGALLQLGFSLMVTAPQERLQYSEIEMKQWRQQLLFLAHTLQRGIGREDWTAIHSSMATFGADPAVRTLLISDPSGHVISATQPDLAGQEPALLPQLRPLFQSAREMAGNEARFLTTGQDRQIMLAMLPIEFPGESGDLLPRKGALLAEIDMHQITQMHEHAQQTRLTQFMIVLLLVAAALWLFIHFYVAKRLHILLHALESLDSDKPQASIKLGESDELGRIGVAFNRMTQRLAAGLQAIQRREAELREVLDNVAEGVVMLGTDGAILRANPAACRLFDQSAEALSGQRLVDLLSMHAPEARQWLRPPSATTSDPRQHTFVAIAQRNDGSPFPLEMTVRWTATPDGLQGVASFRDIRERLEQERRLEHLARHDALTQLPNRLALHHHLHQTMGHALTKRQELSVLFMDLDRFKWVNDALGHSMGDKLLEAVAERLKSTLRDRDFLARLGGDEFVVVAEHSPGQDGGVDALAQRLIETNNPPYDISGHEVYVGLSIGIATFPRDAETIDELLQWADTAMYAAKSSGRNTFRHIDPALRADAERTPRLENELRRAIKEEQLIPYYQPIYCLRSQKLKGQEALMRWQHPEHGLQPPNEFIPVLEETGLIVEAGRQMLTNVCRQVRAWLDADLPAHCSINISARQLREPNLIEEARRCMEGHALPMHTMTLELTESILMEGGESAIKTLRELRTLGFRIAIDDFGTGYSSLAYLRHLPIDILKIDRAFIQGLPDSMEDAGIVRTIVELARQLGLTVVAEGIETAEQAELLTSIGVHEGQGFLFARPQPAEAIPGLPLTWSAPHPGQNVNPA
ncbi:MAG: putative bifunctional diguanylate cyclase/phosphodiesterase [Pseudomonadota bacterium]